MPDFFVTFGQKYREEPHPRFKDAHPDGWLRIVARTHFRARQIAFSILGQGWAGLYAAEDFHPGYYSRGELGVRDFSFVPSDDLETA